MCSVFRSQWITSYLGWFCCWFSLLSPRGSSLETSVFSSPQKSLFLNSISFWDMQTEGPLWWCAIFKILFKFYFFIVVGFRSLPERFYSKFFLFLVPFKTFQNDQTSKNSMGILVSLLPSRFQCRHANDRRRDPKNGCERNKIVVDEEQLCCCASSKIYILFYFILLLLFTVKTSHAELNFNDCYQSSTDKIAFFFFIFLM